MTCEPNELLELAKCYRCIPKGMTLEVWIYLLTVWLTNNTAQGDNG